MTTWNDVLRWVRTSAPESDRLDFKAAFWPKKPKTSRAEEIAKDLAAFMNHRGGTIVIGLGDSHDRCAGFRDAPLPRDAQQIVQQAALRHLVPAEAAAGVHIQTIGGDDAHGDARQVLLVEIAAWPHGPVGLRLGDLKTYRFPVRHGAHTEELTWEETMRRLDAGHRRMWLRCKEWSEGPSKVEVSFGTGIFVARPGGDCVALPLPLDGSFALLWNVEQDVVHLRMHRMAYVRWMASGTDSDLQEWAAGAKGQDAMWLALGRNLAIHQAWQDTSHPMGFALPLGLIRDAWLDKPRKRLQVLLDADLVFGAGSWHLRPIRR